MLKPFLVVRIDILISRLTTVMKALWVLSSRQSQARVGVKIERTFNSMDSTMYAVPHNRITKIWNNPKPIDSIAESTVSASETFNFMTICNVCNNGTQRPHVSVTISQEPLREV